MDFFQLLINAADDLGDELSTIQEDRDIVHDEISKSKKKGLTKIEVITTLVLASLLAP